MSNANQSPPNHPAGVTCIDPEPHAYDDPNISPRQFLLAVMHDLSVPLSARMDAATKLLYLPPEPPPPPEPRLTIRIEGFPSLHFMATLAYIKWCHDNNLNPDNDVLYGNYLREHGLEHDDLLSMQVQGHA